MSDRKRAYDVYLTSTPEALEAAVTVEAALASAGLAVFSPLSVALRANVGERLREELGAALTLVAVFGQHVHLPPNLALEVGAALAWKKPTFAVLNDASAGHGILPVEVQVVSMSDLRVIIREIQEISQPLSSEQRQLLADIYTQVNVPPDQLSRSPDTLSQFADRFNKVAGRHWSRGRVLREVLVMRKSGRLPKLRKNGITTQERVPT